MSFHSPVRRSVANAAAQSAASQIEPKTKIEEKPRCVTSSMDFDMDAASSYTDDDSETSPRGPTKSGMGSGVWSKEEHTKFLEAIKIYPNGPWKLVAAYVGTRTVRQTMTHAQKYRQKAARRLRGLRTKQALMRMHFGHRVSEESLIQERLRSMGATQVNPHTCDPLNYAFPAPDVVTMRRPMPDMHQHHFEHHQHLEHLEHPQQHQHVVPVVDAATTSSNLDKSFDAEPEPQVTYQSLLANDTEPSHPDVDMGVEEIELLEDLSASPSLEECATVLLDLLF